MAELEELEQEELNKKMTNIRLPNVPSSSLPAPPERVPGRMASMPSSTPRTRAGLFPTLTTCGHIITQNNSQAYSF